MYDSGDYSISDLAEVFSVSRPTVYRPYGDSIQLLRANRRHRGRWNRGKILPRHIVVKHYMYINI
jgi:hypothetical protein